jgi:hypothetical protein
MRRSGKVRRPAVALCMRAVFESGWNSAAFIQHHRTEVAQAYQGRGRQVSSLDWTLSHHERGPQIYAVSKGYDYVERRTTWFQTGVTAVVSNRDWIDGREIVAQDPKHLQAEAAYLKATVKESYEQMAEVQQRLALAIALPSTSTGVPQAHGDGRGDRAPAGGRRSFPRGLLCL